MHIIHAELFVCISVTLFVSPRRQALLVNSWITMMGGTAHDVLTHILFAFLIASIGAVAIRFIIKETIFK